MHSQLVEIHPRELNFIFEVKKQSSCAVHLGNATDQFVAFKVKTTSPKKYCVRPNVGIIKPRSTYDFTVTMQAQKSAPSDFLCKDKFLIQSTVVPYGTTEDEILPSMFAKDSEKYIEETKLRVVLSSPLSSPVMAEAPGVLKQEASYDTLMPKEPPSPELLPVSGGFKQEPSYETSIPQAPVIAKQEASHDALKPKEPHSPVLLPVNGAVKPEPSYETLIPKDKTQSGDENSPPHMVQLMKKVDTSTTEHSRNMEESLSFKIMDNIKSVPTVMHNIKPVPTVMDNIKSDSTFMDNIKSVPTKEDMEAANLKLAEDIEALKTKINAMDVKLEEAEHIIVKLKEEKSSTVRDMDMLKQELAMVRRKGGRKAQVGFPPLFVCMVAMISLVLGFLCRS